MTANKHARDSEWLAEQGIEMLEQPFSAAQHDDHAWLKARSPLPIFADEACVSAEVIPELAEAYDGVNIKLMKCGGLLKAHDSIAIARSLGLQTMLGCMVESSLGIAAAASLAPLVDYIDLDGNLCLQSDPYDLAQKENHFFVLGERDGI